MATTGHKVAAAGAAIVIAEPAFAMMHTGGIGVICGLVAGAIAYTAVEDIERVAGRNLPSLPASRRSPSSPGAKQPSLAHRLLNGKSVREEAQQGMGQPAHTETMTQPSSADGDEEEEDDFEHLQTNKGPFTFSRIIANGWRPSLESIFLARLEDGRDVLVTVEQLLHIALAGSTRQGKTSIIRQVLLQLCYVGCSCLLLDPHYTPYDIETGEDWTPFVPYLRFDPLECKSYDRISQILRHAATTLLDKRKALREQMKPVGKPTFFVIDELPAIIAERPEVQKYLAKLLREGAKYKLYLCTASQDYQVKTISPQSGGAIRDNYKTCLYVGGDMTTARVLLDTDEITRSVEATLGKGLVYLRCAIQKHASLAYTPWTDNQALYDLLGPSTYEPEDEITQDEGENDDLDDALVGHNRAVATEATEVEPEPTTEALAETEPKTTPRMPTPFVQDKGPRAEEIDLRAAVTLWNSGYNSERKLMRAFPGLTLHQAGKLREMIIEQAEKAEMNAVQE